MPLQLNICVPIKQLTQMTVEYVQLPSELGSMGILSNHAPLRCVLAPGIITCRIDSQQQKVFSVSGGVAMVKDNVVTILADTAEAAEDIDMERAHAAEKRALERLQSHDEKIDRARAEAALKRSLARIKAHEVSMSVRGQTH